MIDADKIIKEIAHLLFWKRAKRGLYVTRNF